MPIEEALEKIPENGKAGIISQPTILLPVDKCMTAYEYFARATCYVGSFDRYLTEESPKLIETCEKFLLFTEFYLTLRGSLDKLVLQLHRWRKSFPTVYPSEKLGSEKQPDKAPKAVKNWIISETEQAFSNINRCGYPNEIEALYHPNLAPVGNRINEVWSDLHNTNGLMDTIILGSALCENVDYMNSKFNVKPLKPEAYISTIVKLMEFARDKSIIYYRCRDAEVYDLKDYSPRQAQPKKSFFKRLWDW